MYLFLGIWIKPTRPIQCLLTIPLGNLGARGIGPFLQRWWRVSKVSLRTKAVRIIPVRVASGRVLLKTAELLTDPLLTALLTITNRDEHGDPRVCYGWLETRGVFNRTRVGGLFGEADSSED